MIVIDSSIFMKSEPSENSRLETECLFGETVEILEEYLDWVYCRLDTDNYHGWVKKKGLGKVTNPTHRVIVQRSFVYDDKDPKSNCLFYLPMGAKLHINNIQSEWAEINLYTYKNPVGYIPSSHIDSLDHRVDDWVITSELFLGTPYKWGGRNSLGIDCSALLQLSYQTYGEVIPRNTSEQIKLKKPEVNQINNLDRGCVVFWEGHVGIMVDRFNCIHANAYHMKTVTEPLVDIISRMDKDHQIVKMMDFN